MVSITDAGLIICTSDHFGKQKQASLKSCVTVNDPNLANDQKDNKKWK